jgi:hypothetical protein
MGILGNSFRFLTGMDMHSRLLRVTTGGKVEARRNQEKVKHLGHQVMEACEVLSEQLLNRLGKGVSARTFHGWRLDAWLLLVIALSPTAALMGRTVWRFYHRLRHLSVTVPPAASGPKPVPPQEASDPGLKPPGEMETR